MLVMLIGIFLLDNFPSTAVIIIQMFIEYIYLLFDIKYIEVSYLNITCKEHLLFIGKFKCCNICVSNRCYSVFINTLGFFPMRY